MEELQEATARLEAEIEALEEYVHQMVGVLLTQSGSMPWGRVLRIKGHLYYLCKAFEEKRRELRRRLEAIH